MADFVVTGTGRCGTGLCMIALKQMGVPAAHEEFFHLERRAFGEDDRRAYLAYPTNDVSLMAAPFLTQIGLPIIHLVRNPVDTVNSFLNAGLVMRESNVVTDYINHFMPLEGETNADLWADYWVKWNRMCAESATFTVQIEQLTSGDISDAFFAPIIGAPGFVQHWRAAGRFKNRRHDVTGDLVPADVAERLRRAGTEYGYAA